MTPHLPRPPTTSKTLFARPLHTAPHPKTNHTKRVDTGSCSDREKPLLQLQRSHSLHCSARTPANSSGGGGCTKPGQPKTTQYVDTSRGSRAAGPGDAGLGWGVGGGTLGGWASPPSPRSGGGGGARSLGEAPLAAGPHPRPLRAAPEPPLQTRGAGCGKAAATASERITYPSLLRGTGRGGGARRVP